MMSTMFQSPSMNRRLAPKVLYSFLVGLTHSRSSSRNHKRYNRRTPTACSSGSGSVVPRSSEGLPNDQMQPTAGSAGFKMDRQSPAAADFWALGEGGSS